ncbi:Mov34/MPN/PAD-1 family protein [Aeromicrobium sp. Leaf350]|uniref:Mov34/MPN/PAD-1 family protein n=1 Tax=Aeromicrobium sp. Leaf350 TaxID=2876565 RepID=UPI001E37C60B|nr:Mov34/MPN/PAD-1 family protein [Aeromicrobium sp. Leaf350]
MTDPKLLIVESAVMAMTRAAQKSYPLETGGILVGVHATGEPWVTSAIEIPTSDRGSHHYRIPQGATQATVRAARRDDPRIGYLGDWHSHPSDVGPSPTDLASLAYISMRHPLTPNPTSIVLRRTEAGYVLDARRIVAVKPRFCVIRHTGNLPTSAEQEST